MVDLGHSWRRETLSIFDIVVTDDFDQGGGASGFNFDGVIDADLPQVVSGASRAALIFSGTGLADVAVAAAVFERALERNIGTVLPL